jgi:CO/xanthine dehydrogenase Mo-binding subunit
MTGAIGQRLPMLDAVARVCGDVPFVLNADAPGCLVGRLVRSRRPHARLVRVDTAPAARVPGVRAVVSGADVRADGRLSPFFGAVVRDQPLLALDRVRYVGEPLAAVAADDDDAAAEAAELVEVEYDDLPPILDLEAALAAADAPAAEYVVAHGDPAVGFAEAERVLEGVYRTPSVAHAALEPHVVLAQVDAAGRVVVHSSTQTPHHVRGQLAEIFGLPLTQVRVLVPTLGGAFGGKCYPKIEPLAVLLARAARRPVKLVLSRAEEFVTTARPPARVTIRSGSTADGRLLAVDARVEYANGAYTETAERLVRHGARALTAAYGVPHLRVVGTAVYTNTTPCGPFRAPGAAQAIWAMESHLDEIARALGLDPLELRLRNLVRSGDGFVDGGLLEDICYPAMLRTAAAAVGWGEPKAPIPPSGPVRVGRGLAVAMKTTQTPATATATLKLNDDGSLDVLTSSVEMGQGASTVLAQLAAEPLGLDPRRVRVAHPDTDLTPYDQGTSSSRTTFAMGEAIGRAAAQIAAELRQLAAERLEVAPDDVALADGRAAVRGAPERGVDLAALVRGARRGNLLGTAVHVTRAKPDPRTGRPGASAHYHQAVGAAEVAVDVETGRVRVLRLHAGVFAGRAVNPTLCELQTEGSALFGLGQALFEAIETDGGQVSNANLGDYQVPSPGDLPGVLGAAIHEQPGTEEVHGIGEIAAPVAPPAIANAVADAVGVRIRELPLTPERVLRALREQGATRA